MNKYVFAAVATVAMCAFAGVLPAQAIDSRTIGLGILEVGKVEGVLPSAPAFLVALSTPLVVRGNDRVLCTESVGIVQVIKGAPLFVYSDLDNGADVSKCFYFEDFINLTP